MRANLARHGRRLLVCRAMAPSCAPYAAPTRRRPILHPIAYTTFERTFLDILFKKPPREVRHPEYEPGWLQIMVWRSRMLDNLRPPPRKELLESWKKLMQSKLNSGLPLNSTQALQCRRLLEYFSQPLPDAEQSGKLLSTVDLSLARQVLLEVDPQERSQNHLDFAKALYEVMSSGKYAGKARSLELQWSYLVKLLCRYGGSQEALQMLYSKWEDANYAPYLVGEHKLVEVVAQGLAREGREKELVELVEYATARDVPYSAGIQSAMVLFFAERDRVPETQHWLKAAIDQSYSQVKVYPAVASFAKRNGLQDWAMPFFLELGQSQPRKKHWDALLQAILLLGNNLKEVEAMMGHMVDRKGEVKPSINTINGLLSVAVETKNADLGEEILALAAEKDLALSGETYIILLRLGIETENWTGAQEAYRQVKRLEPWNDRDQPAVFAEFRQLANRYLVALSSQPHPDFKHILSVVESSEEDQISMDPETVASLCLAFLENDQHFDVMDMLSVHSFRYSEGQRELVQNAFITFCLDPNTSTSRAWSGYQLLHQYFQDTSFERRMKLMQVFFDRKRPDMASHVFGHMRAHRNKSYHPTMETYIACLEGFARYPDLEGLEMIHNMLKMDTTVQPNTKLYTGLMLAYTACDNPLRALDFWNDITQSQEGPSYASLEAVLWTLEKRPGGHKQAREIWERIERMDVEVPPSVYNAYVGATAGAGNEKEIRGLIMKMASFVGSEPDAMTLAVAYNALPGQELQKGFQEWAKTRYPEIWADLDKVGRRMNEFSLCQFKVNRVMKT